MSTNGMSKNDYLDALRRAMTGLAPPTQAKTLAYYEQRFIDGVAAGRSEAEIAQELDDPTKIAMTLRASSHLHSFEQKKNPADLLRVMVSAVGLAIFNLFMVVPAMVYAALLASLYACALAFYLGGVAVTASGLSGANELALAGPLSKLGIVTDMEDSDLQTKVSIGTNGVHLFQEKVPQAEREGNTGGRDKAAAAAAIAAAHRAAESAGREAARAAREAGQHAAAAAREAARAGAVAADVVANAEAAAEAASDAAEAAVADVAEAAEAAAAAEVAALDDANGNDANDGSGRGARVMRRAEAVAERGIHITTEMDPGSRATQTFFGLGMVLCGIILFLLSLVVTKYTLIGARRYIEMNFSLLKGS